MTLDEFVTLLEELRKTSKEELGRVVDLSSGDWEQFCESPLHFFLELTDARKERLFKAMQLRVKR